MIWLSFLHCLSERPLIGIDSRSEILVGKIKELEDCESFNQKNGQFLVARDKNRMVEELHYLSRHFPSLEELAQTKRDLQHSLQIAVASKRYEKADQLQKCLESVQKQISTELKFSTNQEGIIHRLSSF